ncbi:hypothetical protein [Streptomyces caelestis]|uniref:hypothetical protein n=1 Tax=Streptomyces caelestis TaxID=36816 RepID=UPI0036FF7ECC
MARARAVRQLVEPGQAKTCSLGSHRASEAPEGAHCTVSRWLSLDPADCACGGSGWLDSGFCVWEGDVHLAADERFPLHAS